MKELILLNTPNEGDVFKVISLKGQTFEIKYGYYEDFERKWGEPIPIYPDFINNPCYTDDGKPFVTQMQDACEHGGKRDAESFCVECNHFRYGEDLIGFCNLAKNKKRYKKR